MTLLQARSQDQGVIPVVSAGEKADNGSNPFSKLKLIKTYLRSSISQERLDGLAMISIESKEAKALDMNKLIDEFAENKARRDIFCV